MTAHLTRRKADQTGRSTGKFADPRFKKLNAPPKDENWVWLSKSMIEGYAWRAMSGAAQKVVSRIMLEHLAHGGCQNGELAVTYADFENYGIGASSVLPALAEATALGFIERTRAGEKAWGAFKGRPARYRILWLPAHDGTAPEEKWRRFGSLAEARSCVEAVRRAVADEREQFRRAPPGHANAVSTVRTLAAE